MSAQGSALLRGTYGAYGLAERELKRFLRQPNRVFGALAQPILFWVMFGAGLSSSFRPSAGATTMSYWEYFFPGSVVLILLFTAIFATISIIEDRNEGFLQSVLVAPIPTASIVAGKVAGTTALAVGQALLFFLLAPVAGLPLTLTSLALSIPLLILIALGLTGLGFTIAWQLDSTQGFHAVMTAFLMPMWLLSGAFFPTHGIPTWLATIVALNPLTYGVAAFRRVLYLGDPAAVADLPGLGFSIAVLVAFSAMTLAAATTVVARRGPRPSGR